MMPHSVPELRVTSDENTGITRVSVSASRLQVTRSKLHVVASPLLSAFFEFDGVIPRQPIDSITLRYVVEAPVGAGGTPFLQYVRQHRLSAIIDGNRRQVATGGHEIVEQEGGAAYEVISFSVPTETITDLGRASSLLLRVGPTECKVSRAQQEGMQSLVIRTSAEGFERAQRATDKADALLRNKAAARHPHLLQLSGVLDQLRDECVDVPGHEWERILAEIPPGEMVVEAFALSAPSPGAFCVTDRRAIQILVFGPGLSDLYLYHSDIVKATRAVLGDNTTIYAFENVSGESVVAVLEKPHPAADRSLSFIAEAAGIQPEYLTA